MSIHERLALTCDAAGCRAEIVSGPLRFHGSDADVRALEEHARRAGWARVNAVVTDEGTRGPWHYCPLHQGPGRARVR